VSTVLAVGNILFASMLEALFAPTATSPANPTKPQGRVARTLGLGGSFDSARPATKATRMGGLRPDGMARVGPGGPGALAPRVGRVVSPPHPACWAGPRTGEAG
jgi:hypothetical protein